MAERLDDALACSERALSFARERKERGFEAWALRSLGEIAARKQPTDIARAEGSYRAALTLAAELGMHPLVARCHLGLGKLYRSAGQPEQARERLTTGTTMFQDMKMQNWLADAEAEMHQLG